MPLIQFEYLTSTIDLNTNYWGTSSDFPAENIDIFLNEKGAEGWELVSITPNTNHSGRSSELLLIFKRQK